MREGSYLIAPLSVVLHNGWFATTVTIRNLAAPGAVARVLRLTRLFRDATAAADYAHSEGLRFVRALSAAGA